MQRLMHAMVAGFVLWTACPSVAQQNVPATPPAVQVTRSPIASKIEPERNVVEIANFTDPSYPSLAQAAKITGEVVLKLRAHKNGVIDSVEVMSGNPILAQAALESTRHTQFQCRGCDEEIAEAPLVYSFELEPAPGWPCSGENGPRVTRIRDRISVVSEPRLVDLYFASIPARSAKCFYLWQCGWRSGGVDYYCFRVRSPKCLGLWNCGRELREPYATCHKLHRKIL